MMLRTRWIRKGRYTVERCFVRDEVNTQCLGRLDACDIDSESMGTRLGIGTEEFYAYIDKYNIRLDSQFDELLGRYGRRISVKLISV